MKQWGTTGWEKWNPMDGFKTSDDCAAAITRTLSNVRPPDEVQENIIVQPMKSGVTLRAMP